jgi:hypothetical protein
MSVLLNSRQAEGSSFPPSGNDPLRGRSDIPSQPVIAEYEDSYSDLDRRIGLALFDSAYRRGALAALKESLVAEPPRPAIRQGSLAAVAV